MGISVADYQALLLGVAETVKTTIIAPNSTGSHIETRYIASEGRDDESWLGYLRDTNNVVDIWLITCNYLVGASEENAENRAVGTFNKPYTLTVDYFADYKQGVDFVDTVATNTEHEFLKKLFAVDLALEKNRHCLGNKLYIQTWSFRTKLRRFQTATTHWANGIINFEFDGIIL
jgi:hypothetical protein